MQPITISVEGAAAMIGLSRATLYRMMERNEVETVKVGGRRLVRIDSINKLLGVA